MKLSRKISALLLSAVMLFSLIGCTVDTDISESGLYSTVSTLADGSSLSDDSVMTSETDSDKSHPEEFSSEADENSQTGSSIGSGTAEAVKPSDIPAFSGNAYVVINNNQPNFSSKELTTKAYESYSNLDIRGRCGAAIASCGKEIMPADSEERGSISSVYPSGWKQAKYSGISGGYIWNRCHLIGWQLSTENANRKNLITGTRYMNINGMLPFENIVADYIRETGNHVAYRITPIFEGNNLVCSGVQMEAYSIEDKGESVCFNVYCYNVQPGIKINYATGDSTGPGNETTKPSVSASEPTVSNNNTGADGETVWIPSSGTKYHSNSGCSNMTNPTQVTKDEAIKRGYEPCKKCY